MLFPSRALSPLLPTSLHLFLSDSSCSNNHSSSLHQPSRYPSHCRHNFRNNLLVIAIIAFIVIPSSLHRIFSPSVLRARSSPPPPRSFLWSSITITASSRQLQTYPGMALSSLLLRMVFSAVCRLFSLLPSLPPPRFFLSSATLPVILVIHCSHCTLATKLSTKTFHSFSAYALKPWILLFFWILLFWVF